MISLCWRKVHHHWCLIASLVSTQRFYDHALLRIKGEHIVITLWCAHLELSEGHSLSKHQIQLSLSTSPTEVPHHCMGLLHTTYFIPKKKNVKKFIFFFGKDWVREIGLWDGGNALPPLFDIFYENWMVRSYAIDWSKIDIVSSQNFLITLWSHCESAKFKPTSCSLQVFLRFLKDSLI